jgi:hypothetical protein
VRPWGLLLGFGAAAVTACGCDVPEQHPIDETRCGAIVGGSTVPSFLGMTGAQARAVVAVLKGRDTPGDSPAVCSGVLVGPRHVLTAGHCLDSARSPMSVTFGADLTCADQPTLAGMPLAAHPTLDLALLELAGPPLPEGAQPLPWNEAPITSAWIDRLVQLAGFGSSGFGETGWAPPDLRRFAVEPVREVDATRIVVDGQGRSGACDGDSGGPLLARDARGALVVLGVLSGGASSCQQLDSYVRLDVARDWIRSWVGAPPPAAGCDAIDSVGRCYDGRSVRCEGGALRVEECVAPSRCALAAAGHYGCIAQEESPCGFVDQLGACQEGRALRCDAGHLTAADCGAAQSSCLRSPSSGHIECG